jgi:hypothetical protein
LEELGPQLSGQLGLAPSFNDATPTVLRVVDVGSQIEPSTNDAATGETTEYSDRGTQSAVDTDEGLRLPAGLTLENLIRAVDASAGLSPGQIAYELLTGRSDNPSDGFRVRALVIAMTAAQRSLATWIGGRVNEAHQDPNQAPAILQQLASRVEEVANWHLPEAQPSELLEFTVRHSNCNCIQRFFSFRDTVCFRNSIFCACEPSGVR